MSLLDEAFIGWHMNVREIENYAFGTYDVLYGYVESHRFRSCLSVIHESHESLWNWSENFSAKRKSLIKICWVYKNCNKINPWNWNCVMMNKIEDFLIFFLPYIILRKSLTTRINSYFKSLTILLKTKTMKMTAMTIIENVHWVEWSEMLCEQ